MNLRNRTIYIGDNLRRLRGIDSESVDLIYLDPPFNSRGEYQWPIGTDEVDWDDDLIDGEGDDLDDEELENLIGGNGVDKFKDAFTLDDLDERTLQELLASGEPAGYVLAAAGAAVGPGTQAYLTFMWERLVEMRRILKRTGSIYLHCDDTEGAWLQVLMEAIFGRSSFRNVITWQRTSSHNVTKRYGRIADHLLFYAMSDDAVFDREGAARALDHSYINREYSRGRGDPRGRWRRSDLTGPSLSPGESGEPWSGYDPSAVGRHWAVPLAVGNGDYADWIAENVIEGYALIEGVHDRLEALDANGLIHWTRSGTPELKRYLAATTGQVPGTIWTDINPVVAGSKEWQPWDTQKPLALLERVIAASSKEGDLVLDPFCGCATACVAAERLHRQWVGMDRSPRAGILVRKRLREQNEGIAMWAHDVTVTRAIPQRTDITEPPLSKAQIKAALFERQQAHANRYPIPHAMCAGPNCGTALPIHLLEIDRIRPGSFGGDYELDNTQLLCGWCNRVKGNRDVDYLAERIAQRRAREQEILDD